MKKIFTTVSMLVIAVLLTAGSLRAQAADPLALAKAAADRELFGRVIADDNERPPMTVHHNWYWLDGTLMAGVAALYDRTVEVGHPVPRYLDYLEAWGAHDPGGHPYPIFHGDAVCAGQTYIWLYLRTGNPDYLHKTDGMVDFIFKARKPTQYMVGYPGYYWMRFWQDDVHMVAPFLAMRGQAAGSQGIPNGKDARELAMIYCRAYDAVLRDPATGLYWHNPRARGQYHWGRGNGWVAAGFFKVMRVLDRDPAHAADAAWLRERLVAMAQALKDNRNDEGTWNADVVNRAKFTEPETSGSAFFTFMIAGMVNDGKLGDDYAAAAKKAWSFLASCLTPEGGLTRVQPTGRGPISTDFSQHSETFGVGAFILAAVEVSKLPE